MHIKVRDLMKTYRVPVRETGFQHALKQFYKRDYKEIVALDGIDFDIPKGQLVGYLGPNGAGKSTTLKVLTGILVPDSGLVDIAGRTPWLSRMQHVKNIGVVFGQKTQLWWDLPVNDSFELIKAIYKISDATYQKTKSRLIESLQIAPFLRQPVRQLSLGQRMRCELAASLLHLPELLFLDEPTIGLDAISKRMVREFIKDLNTVYGSTVILTTHDMDDVEALVERVMVIDQGKLAFDGSLQGLRQKVHNKKRIIVDYVGKPLTTDLEHAEICGISDSQITYEYQADSVPPQELIQKISQNMQIKDLLIENPPIEEIIARLYGDLS